MVGLKISPLRGLSDLWFALSYNLFISSGLKKMTQAANHQNMSTTYHFGLKALFDGYLMTFKFLCDGYVTGSTYKKYNLLIIRFFLCDSYVISSPILFDGHLIKK